MGCFTYLVISFFPFFFPHFNPSEKPAKFFLPLDPPGIQCLNSLAILMINIKHKTGRGRSTQSLP